MEDESGKNRKPKEENSQLPIITLGVLVLIVLGLLYAGYETFKDDSIHNNELTNVSKTTNEIEASRVPEEVPKMVAEKEIPEQKDKEIEEEIKAAQEKEQKIQDTNKQEEANTEEASSTGLTINHKVQKGETFLGIANRYNLSQSKLQKMNTDVMPDNLKIGVTTLKVKIQAMHTVGAGDVLRVVAQKYGVTKQAIMDANNKTKDFAARGEKLIIPIK
ncbi:MAG: LysM peptidoglycan-binding domain-containing protein [Pseudarcicella sp.]|nr:LysM peptidoglycan-binding domain-containing protein [Pseudarcicella sp.]